MTDAEAKEATVSRQLGSRYVLDDVLGRGATGEVWRGHDRDGATLACKVLHDSLAHDPEVVRRFVQERAILTGLDHPNLVRMRDLVVEGNTLAIVMDHIAGRDLRALLAEQGTLPPGEACRIGAEVAAGLAAAHAGGVVHRDIKPENILLDTGRTPAAVRLTDFGIAKIAESSGTGRTTLLAGTPQYIAPELFDGQEPTPAVDLYALGIVLYELCCGVTPYADSGSSALAVLRRHADHLPGRPDGIPEPLWEVIVELLAKDPQVRLGPASRVANVLGALSHDLAGVPAAPALSEPPPSIPVVHTQPTELVTQPTPPTPSPARGSADGRRRRVAIVAAVGGVIALAIGGGAAAALSGGGSEPGEPDPTSGPAAAVAATGSPADAPATASPAATSSPSPQPGLMPDLVGVPETRARQRLPDGVAVEVVTEPAPVGTPVGVVLAQEPAKGEPMDDAVVLTVSANEVTVRLVDLEPVDSSGDVRAEVTSISGERYLDSLTGGYRCCRSVRSGHADYDLGRNYVTLHMVAGLSDRSAYTEADVLLEITGDGTTLVEQPLVFGEAVELDIDVTNVLRLELHWTYFNNPSRGGHRTNAEVAFGAPVLTAAPGYDPDQES